MAKKTYRLSARIVLLRMNKTVLQRGMASDVQKLRLQLCCLVSVMSSCVPG